MILRMQFQILINTGPNNSRILILVAFLMTSFTSLSVTPLVCNAASELNYLDSSQK